MRRAAAILGPTPPFLRWAIQSRCPFLRIGKGPFSESAWRQLRVFKEISAACEEGRVWGDICFARESSPNAILGFSIAEATHTYGGREHVDATCQSCPSNSTPNFLAGCTGLALLVEQDDSNSPANLESLTARFQALLQAAEEVMSADDLAQRCRELDRRTSPRWYGLWKNSVLKAADLHLAIDCLHFLQAKGMFLSPNCQALLVALDFCLRTKNELHVEFVGFGYSDGVDWVLPSNCKACGCEWTATKQNNCQCCGAVGSFCSRRRRRVLGRRPFLDLERVLGATEARKMWLQYETHRNAIAKIEN